MIHDLPAQTIPPVGEDFDDPNEERPSGLMVAAIPRSTVAVAAHEPSLHAAIEAALGDEFPVVKSRDGIASAAVVIYSMPESIASLRKASRPDAAFLALLPAGADEATITATHAAGAFACVHQPLVGAQLRGLVDSAMQSHAAKTRFADLSKELDLRAHLTTVGRISVGLGHELASPLTVIQSACDIALEHLAGQATAEMTREALTDAESALQRITRLLRTLQELAQQRRCTLTDTRLDSIAASVHHAAALRFPSVAFDLAVNEPLASRSNATFLQQLLTNLTTNAAQAASRFDSPRVRVHVYRSGQNAVISVRDNGPGIPLAEQERIFEPFYTTRRDAGGTGLGLALCREYAVQIGADLSLWSIPGRGACFRITLPL